MQIVKNNVNGSVQNSHHGAVQGNGSIVFDKISEENFDTAFAHSFGS